MGTEPGAEGSSGKKKKSKSTSSPNKKQKVEEVPLLHPGETEKLKVAWNAVVIAMRTALRMQKNNTNKWRTMLSSLVEKKKAILAGLPANANVDLVTEYWRYLQSNINEHNGQKTHRLAMELAVQKWKKDCENAFSDLQKPDTTAEIAKAKVDALVSGSTKLTGELDPLHECMKTTLGCFRHNSAVLIEALRGLQKLYPDSPAVDVDLEPEATFQPKSKAARGGAAQVVIDEGGALIEGEEEEDDADMEEDDAGPSDGPAAQQSGKPAAPVTLCAIATPEGIAATIPPRVPRPMD